MHHFEFALRDFMNIEPHCRPDSLIVLHDCLPVDEHMARRDPRDRSRAADAQYPDAWAGDTWKALWILQRYRPDLRIFAFDAPPSGLVVVTYLDPASTLLKQRYEEVVGAASAIDLASFYAGLDDSCRPPRSAALVAVVPDQAAPLRSQRPSGGDLGSDEMAVAANPSILLERAMVA